MNWNDRIVSVVLVAAVSGAVHAHEWIIDEKADELDSGSKWAGCFGFLGSHDSAAWDTNSTLQLWTNNWTMYVRNARGDDDVLKPLLFLAGVRADRGRSRPLGFPQFGRTCDEEECEADLNEFRISYQLDHSRRATEAWVQRYYAEGPHTFVFRRESAEEEPFFLEYPSVYWPDYPDEMFNTDATRSIRLNFGGIGSGNLTDSPRPRRHHSHIRFTYAYGLDAMNAVNECVQDHLKSGRLDNPYEDTAVQAAWERSMEFLSR